MSGYSDLTVYESEAERHAVCAELARMLRVVPLNFSSATSDAASLPVLGSGVVGESNLETSP
jgi:hypothetical protein